MTTPIPATVFLDPHPGDCCDCCNGYCPAGDMNLDRPEVFRVLIDGIEHYTDRYVAIRANLIVAEDVTCAPTKVPDVAWQAESVTPEITVPLSWAAVRTLMAGLDIAGQQTESRRLVLERDGERVGWAMGAKGGTDLDGARRVAMYAQKYTSIAPGVLGELLADAGAITKVGGEPVETEAGDPA